MLIIRSLISSVRACDNVLAEHLNTSSVPLDSYEVRLEAPEHPEVPEHLQMPYCNSSVLVIRNKILNTEHPCLGAAASSPAGRSRSAARSAASLGVL